MTTEEQRISDDAHEYIRKHTEEVIQRFTKDAQSVARPVSLFLAGSPGAGKTEVSRSLIKRFKTMPVRIDADEIRAMCPGYIGKDAHLFQKAATKGVHILYDYALNKKLHLILDGTFAYGDSAQNIKRSIDKHRIIELWFVYQDPKKAWEVTIAREALERRHVSKEIFIKAFLKSQENAKNAKKLFGSAVVLNLLVKNTDHTDGILKLNIQAEELDAHIGASYSEENLIALLS